MPTPRKRTPRTRATRTTPRAEVAQHALDTHEVLTLVASGLTVSEAADRLGVTRQTASSLFNAALSTQFETDAPLRETLLGVELETLRLLRKTWLPRALDGNARAARIVLGIVSMSADLAGLKAAVKIQISSQRIDETVAEIVRLVDNAPGGLPEVLPLDAPREAG